VHGEAEEEFDALLRDAWIPGVAETAGARVAYVLGLLTREVPPELAKPGSWMRDALALRDQWQSRLLRTTRWSPLA
jgi:hypothetical protein